MRPRLAASDPTSVRGGFGRPDVPLQGTLDLAVRRGLIGSNPCRTLNKDERPKRGKKTRAYEWAESEIDELLDAAQRIAHLSEARADYSFALKLAAVLGLREGELLGLRWEDFDKDTGYLHVRRQWLRPAKVDGVRLPARYDETKTPAGVRDLPVPDGLRDELIAYRLASKFSQDSDPVLASGNGTPLGHRNLTRRGWEPARDLAELPKLKFHELRHAAASRLIAAGVDVVTVSKFMGHEDPSITLKVYAHLFDKQGKHDAVRLALAGGAQG
jgi:integrase